MLLIVKKTFYHLNARETVQALVLPQSAKRLGMSLDRYLRSPAMKHGRGNQGLLSFS